MLQAMAQATLIAVKPVAESTNSTRVESSRARKPESGITITSAIRYEVWTQLISSALADSPAWISESELETIWMSRIAMNMPPTMIRKPSQSRTVGAGRAAAGGAAGRDGGAGAVRERNCGAAAARKRDAEAGRAGGAGASSGWSRS